MPALRTFSAILYSPPHHSTLKQCSLQVRPVNMRGNFTLNLYIDLFAVYSRIFRHFLFQFAVAGRAPGSLIFSFSITASIF